MNFNILDFYKNNYSLKKFKMTLTNKKVLYLIYDDNYYYYFNNNFITSNSDINLISFINQLNSKYNLSISNFYPVCFCNDTLVIAFKTIETNSFLRKIFYTNIDKKYQKLISFHRDEYKVNFLSLNVKKEIELSQKYIGRYRFHENVIKKYFLTEEKRKKKEYWNILDKFIPNKKSIIDVSCGDSSDVFKIARKKNYKLIVGNDICINYLDYKNYKDVVFTNDDVEHNNIKEKAYDVAFCKNTLHHMNNLSNINNLLQFINRISNEILIIEIADPKRQGGLPKFLNKYLYTKFLKDAGKCYLSESEFKTIINNNFKNHKIEYSKFSNILGNYMIARITNKE